MKGYRLQIERHTGAPGTARNELEIAARTALTISGSDLLPWRRVVHAKRQMKMHLLGPSVYRSFPHLPQYVDPIWPII